MIKTTKKIKRVAFFGDAEAKVSDQSYIDALATAQLLAKKGYIIVNGGGPGIMGAASIGAKNGGGRVEIVVMDPNKQPDNYEGIDQSNLESADRVYTTDTYSQRLNELIELADAFVIFNGGVGTLSEVGMTWEAAKLQYGHHEPLIFVGKQWAKVVEDLSKGMNFEEKEKRVIEVVEKPEEVLRALERAGS